MHQINDALVEGGSILLSDLSFADGQHVRVVVDEVLPEAKKSYSIEEARRILEGSVIKFDDPFEPMIPLEYWEMLK